MKKILIVEDEIIIGLDISSKLSKLGYHVIDTVTRPEEAEEALKKEIPHLILMDINLKADVDGVDLAKKIRQEYDVPIIFLTSYSDQTMIERSMVTEPYGYIVKPYTDGSLTAALKTCFVRQELEQKIVNQKNMLGNIMNSITDAVVVVDGEGIIKALNSRFEEVVNDPDVVGKTIEEVFDDSIHMDIVKKLYNDNAKEVFSITLNGERKHFLISTSTLAGEGGGIMLTITDLTEMYSMKSALFEAERRFTKIFRKKMVPAVLMKAPEMDIFEINEAFFSLYGLEVDYADEPLRSIIGEEAEELIRNSMDSEGSFRVDMVQQKKIDGKEFYANIRGKKVDFEGVEYYLTDFYDVTEQVRISEMEKDLQQKLIHANKMTSLGTLVSGVVHEINNPNNFIMFNSSLLIEFWEDVCKHFKSQPQIEEVGGMPVDELCSDVEKLIAGIVNGSERIKNIVLDLKGFAKSESGEKFYKVSPADILSTSVRILEHQMSKTTENFVLDMKEPLPYILGNVQKLEQVLINILMNSAEAVVSSEALIEVRCFAENGNVVFEVSDDGVGISPSALSRITEPFFTTKQSKGGTGLGLSIAYTIIKEHSGSMDITSKLGEGTKVRIEIPEYHDEEE